MIKKYTVLFLIIFSTVTGFCQIKLVPFKADSIVRPIIFYGYDFSHVRLVDKKRYGQDIKEFIPKINKYLTHKIPSRRFSRLTETDSVVYNFIPLSRVNGQIIDSLIVTGTNEKINIDSLQNFIEAYDIKEVTGTGCVVIFESFESISKTTSAYLVVFDIESHKILFQEYIKSYDYFTHSNLAVWTAGSYFAVIKLARRLSWDEIKRKQEAEIFSKYYAVDSTTSFRPNMFKTSKDELPFTFGINPVIGLSSTFISGGLHVNADIYHILIGYRHILNPVADFMVDESLNEESYYLGYRIRKNKYAFSVASGIGRTWAHCTSGVGGDCENYEEETVRSIPIFVEYAYFIIPYAGVTFSLNASFSDRGSTIGILCGVKLGISRKLREMRPYNK